jgi:hypothetical protein
VGRAPHGAGTPGWWLRARSGLAICDEDTSAARECRSVVPQQRLCRHPMYRDVHTRRMLVSAPGTHLQGMPDGSDFCPGRSRESRCNPWQCRKYTYKTISVCWMPLTERLMGVLVVQWFDQRSCSIAARYSAENVKLTSNARCPDRSAKRGLAWEARAGGCGTPGKYCKWSCEQCVPISYPTLHC